VLRRLGATPVSLPPGEIFAALKSGVIDAAEFLGPWSDRAMGLQRAARYYYWPGFHEPNGSAECLVNARALAALPDDLRAPAEAAGIPIWRSPMPSQEVITQIQYYHGGLYAQRATLHGVFMEVMGIGVLITGDPSIGKSELALELVSRGHRLVADDAPEFTQIAPDVLSGTCPELLRDFLEVRGLGILNIRALFGDSAIKQSKYLRLIIHLQKMSEDDIRGIDRLRGNRRTREALGVEIPEVTLPVAPGRNLAVLVEAAARTHILAMKGYDASQVFIERQQKQIEKNAP